LETDVDRASPGDPVKMVDLASQRRRLSGRIEQAIARVIEHDEFIMGPEVAELESRLAAFCGVPNAVSCASGTDALLLPLLAWEVGPGDAVVVPSFTFTATVEVVSLVGATPVFADVQEDDANLDASKLERALVAARAADLRPVGIIAVDLFGRPADYPAIEAVASRHDLWVLSDGAQSFGATLNGSPVGTFGRATATSFFPSKPLGAYGDGGAVLTADADLAERLRSLRVHGQGAHKYDAARVGLNSRLDTIQAAVVLQKLDVLPEEVERRQQIAERYTKELADIVEVPAVPPEVRSAWAQYTIRLRDRDRVAVRLQTEGVPSAIYYPKPVHRQAAYARCPRPDEGLPVSDMLAELVLSLPMHPYLSNEAQEHVVTTLRRAVAS
jgi:dTDP-4-amino-4,6-dideoxygalactose transaminase